MSGLSIFKSKGTVPCPAQFNLAQYVLRAGQLTPEKSAMDVIGGPDTIEERWTYGDLTRAVLGSARGFAELGIGPRSKVALRLGHDSLFPVAFLGAIACGAVPVLSSSALTAGEFDAAISGIGGVDLIISGENGAASNLPIPVLARDQAVAFQSLPPAEFARTKADDPAYIVFTSGSSGTPKGVLHAQRAIWARRMMWDGWYGLTPEDRMLHAGAFNWTFTLGTGLLDPWSRGATALVYAGPRERHIWPKIIAGQSASLFAAVPGVFRQILSAPDLKESEFGTLRHGLSAGEALPASTRSAWQSRTNTEIHEALGMSEVSTFISGAPSAPRKEGSLGRPQPGRHVAILDENGTAVPIGTEGQLAVHQDDPGLMLGYLSARGRDLPLSGPWFVTGDLARMSETFDVTHLGRSDAVLTTGGYRIGPEEIEAALTGFDGITEAAVLSVAVKEDVCVLGALYVAASDIDEAGLTAYLAERLAGYKHPRILRRTEGLPRSSNGKLKRSELADLWSRLE